MAQMTPDNVRDLARLISGIRPEWSSQAVLGAIHSVHRSMASTTDVYTISIACLAVAANNVAEPHDMTDETGTQWAGARDLLLGNSGNRRWHDRASRNAIEAAEMARATYDPAGHTAGYLAATAALAARPPRAG